MNWKRQLNHSICSIRELREYIRLTPQQEDSIRRVIRHHPMRITPYYLSLIDPDDPSDPIRKMCIPGPGELSESGEYDTSGEHENSKVLGLQHKYSQTALILLTNACAMYCRHCFRKRLVGVATREIAIELDPVIEYIESHTEINNVLISGGDPLVLSTKKLADILFRLDSIAHLDFIRIGSRTPVTLPHRIIDDDALVELLSWYSKKDRRIYVVTHFNHPREITGEAVKAVSKLIDAGIVVHNQAILMKGINDNAHILSELLNGLAGIGVQPYYVFQCRPVKRVVDHFQVPLSAGTRIVEKAKSMCNGISKRFRYVMSHKSGKIEILGREQDRILLKYHQAKDPAMTGRILSYPLSPTAGWLDDLKQEAEAA